jgi:hypothetical protein
MARIEQVGPDLHIIQFSNNDMKIDYNSRDLMKMFTGNMRKGLEGFIALLRKTMEEQKA